MTRDKEDSAKQKAMRDLAERLDRDIHESTNRLIELHGLEGNAGDDVLTRLADHYTVSKHFDEGRAAVVGGLVGMIVIFPLLGHATWHAYRAIALSEG